MRSHYKIVSQLRKGISIIEAVELLVIRTLGFAALVYELVRGFLKGR